MTMKRFIPTHWRLWLVVAFLAVPVTVRAEDRTPKRLTLAGIATPEMDASLAVLREAYAELGISVAVERHPGDIALERSISGQLDGEVHRIDGPSERHPALVQVPIPINKFQVAVFSLDRFFVPDTWRDLRGRKVGIVRGILASEQVVRELDVERVEDDDALFRALMEGRVDVVVAPVVVARIWAREKLGSEGLVLNQVFDAFLLYHYLHKRHAELVPRLSPILKKMLVDGRSYELRMKVYGGPGRIPRAVDRDD